MESVVVDTNVLVRFLARDDSEQWRIATSIFIGQRVTILSTVLLETEWVLRKVLKFEQGSIKVVFRHLTQSSAIEFEDSSRVSLALELHEAGMDFADAFHLAAVKPGETFMTFDRHLVRAAQRHFNSVSVKLAH
jgi:predicted nucleic-acid-binding protein